jgi:nitroimidazol reductase NimA-like FMN-containing flavoprotein (pyridoxamine 5'-phosphate oxidase superfamily)
MNLPEEEPVIAQPYLASDVRSTSWAEARRRLAEADTYWLAAVRSNGRPHLVPVLAVWLDDALHFVASRTSRKAKNLARDSQGDAFSVSEVGPGA